MVYLLPATYAKAGSPKHEYYGQEGNIPFPNPRCVNFSNVPRVLLLSLKQHIIPPPGSPYPIPQVRTREPRPAPHTCGSVAGIRTVDEQHWEIRYTEAKHPRDILTDSYTRCMATCLCAVYCRTTLSQSCLSQLWFSNIQSYGQKSPTAQASLPIRRTLYANT
jgi:hypothetical protein